jgi:hypothetical protein
VHTLTSPVDQMPGRSPEERQRIRATLFGVGAVQWNFRNPGILEVWLLKQRMKADTRGPESG